MKYAIEVTETFRKTIIVEADTIRKAVDKCWDEYWDNYDNRKNSSSPVFIDPQKEISEVGFDIVRHGTEHVFQFEDRYDHLDR